MGLGLERTPLVGVGRRGALSLTSPQPPRGKDKDEDEGAKDADGRTQRIDVLETCQPKGWLQGTVGVGCNIPILRAVRGPRQATASFQRIARGEWPPNHRRMSKGHCAPTSHFEYVLYVIN